MNFSNHASRAAAYINDRLARNYQCEQFDVDPQPDADGSTFWLQELSATLIEHPDRPRQWVRPALVSDRGHSLLPGPGREDLGDCA
jgi:hypothetical protein